MMSLNPEVVIIKRTAPDTAVAVISLHRPPINALDDDALLQLARALREVGRDPAVKAVVVASSLDGLFCTGGDLKYWPARYPDQPATVSQAGRAVFRRLEELAKPTLAAIDGSVIGDGLSLALACDIRLASPRASFNLPELDYGFIPGWGTIGRLMDCLGRAASAEMLLLGEEITARRAADLGLVNRVVESPDILTAALDMARRLGEKPAEAVKSAKQALAAHTWSRDRSKKETKEMDCFRRVWGGREWRKGVNLFAGPACRTFV